MSRHGGEDSGLIWRKIRRVWRKVIESVNVDDHLDYLYENGALEFPDMELVHSATTSREKTSKLMQILQSSKPPTAVKFFLDSLKISSLHVWEMINAAEPAKEAPADVDDLKRKTADSSDEDEWPALTDTKVKTLETGMKMSREDAKSSAECMNDGLESWSIEAVVNWTDQLNFPGDNLQETFKKQCVSGPVLANITYDDLGNLFPTMPFGHKKTILSERDKLKNKVGGRASSQAAEATTSRVSDRFRKFESVSPDTTYRHNSYLPWKGQHSDNLLEPVHTFVKIEDLNRKAVLRKFQRATLTFAVACLNDRTNGTIHFGVEEDDDGGQIVGIAVDKTKVSEALEKSLQNNLPDGDLNVVKNCVRPPKFVPVVGKDVDHSVRFIVEVDVVASFQLCQYQAFYVRQGAFKLYRFSEGVPVVQTEEEVAEFHKFKHDLAKRRQNMESTPKVVIKQRNKPDLRTKLIHLLCQGETTLEGDLCPILVITKPNRNSQIAKMKEEFGFLKRFPWKAVFDFDNGKNGEASLYALIEEEEQQFLKVLTVEDFDQNSVVNKENPGKFQKVIDDMKNDSQRTWIFTNGYEPDEHEEMGVFNWKESRSEGYKECVRFLRNYIPQGRAVIVFMLLSKDFEVVLEAADELCTRFKNQWLVLAESEEIASQWNEGIMRKNILREPDDLENNCVVGIPWEHVNETITQLLGEHDEGVCQLPTSNGIFIDLPEKIKNDLVDLDILSRNQYNDSDIVKDQSKLAKHSLETEEKFYKGSEVDWWNFYFQSHVYRRSCYNDLHKEVLYALTDTQTDNKVGRVYLYHQPGSGGTTTARNILWDLKDQYRCAVVKNVTDQTCQQISQLHSYDDLDPSPILVLLDNIDSEKISVLKTELEDDAKQITRHEMENQGLFYVFLVCHRGSRPLFRKNAGQCVLKHELKPDEVGWFKKKYQELEKDFNERKGIRRSLDPKHLISFNIMKENFSQEYIKRTVTELVKDTTDPRERTLLKYIALLNAYDLKFHYVLSSSFDPIMAALNMPKRWELHMSQPMKVLLNFSLKNGNGLIRITSNLLSLEILDTLTNASNVVPGQLSDVALEFLNSTIFQQRNRSVEDLLKIVRGIVKKRAKKPNGWSETKFAPLIQTIVDDQRQGVPKASEILIQIFDMTQDVFVAQQVARIYIHAMEWEKAQAYARLAVEAKSDSSVLWDTCGRVHKSRIVQKYNECIQSEKRVNIDEAIEVVDHAILAVEIFQKEQEVSREEKTTNIVSNPGYFGEIAVIVQLLDYLSILEGLTLEELHAFLIGGDSRIPVQMEGLGKERIIKLRGLQHGAMQALAHLEDEYLQLRDDVGDDYRKAEAQLRIGVLIELKENIEHYFGEEDDEVPTHLTLEEACKYRRRRIFRLSGCTLRGMFDILKFPPAKAEQTLDTIRRLVCSNMRTTHKDASDIQALLMVNIALCVLKEQNRTIITHEEMAGLSKQLYEKRNALRCVSLEPYLFVMMFNWPSDDMASQPEVFAKDFADIMRNWKSAFIRKYPRQKEEDGSRTYRRKETTLFFLGKGVGMRGLVYSKELPQPSNSKLRSNFWRTSEAHTRLARCRGMLVDEGKEVKLVKYQNGVKSSIYIPTSLPIQQGRWWNKQVYFVIGFTWSGPKAYDVDIESPESRRLEAPDHSNYARTRTQAINPQPVKIPNMHLHIMFQRELQGIHKQLWRIHQLKQNPIPYYSKEELRLLQSETALTRKKDDLIRSRQIVAETFDLDS